MILDVNPKGYEVSEYMATKVKVNAWMISTLKKKKPIEARILAPEWPSSRVGKEMGLNTDR